MMPGRPPQHNWHHCLICLGLGRTFKASTLGTIRDHLRTAHDVRPIKIEEGVHFTDQRGIAKVAREKNHVHEALVERFSRQLCSVQTVDDFLLDCGEEVWTDWDDESEEAA